MSKRSILLAGIAAIVLLGGAVATVPALRDLGGRGLGIARPATEAAAQSGASAEANGRRDGLIRLGDRQIEEAGIRVAAAGPGEITRRVQLPGAVVPNADRLVRVPARVSGIVTELRHRLGDQVAEGDVLAIIESREIAEAKAEFLATQRNEGLARTIAEREQRMWDRRVSAEQDLLRARNEAEAARIRLQLAEQKLMALGLNAQEIADLPRQPVAALPRREVRAPMAGRIAERTADLGGAVSPETQTFVVLDLSSVWVEMAVSAADLAFLREGQPVAIVGPTPELRGEGRLIFISPTFDSQTRSVRAVAEIANPQTLWRPGIFVAASVVADEQRAGVVVPSVAVQMVAGQPVVFVRNREGFERREVRLGRRDDRSVEIVSGLAAGDPIAVANVFLLRAELNRGED